MEKRELNALKLSTGTIIVKTDDSSRLSQPIACIAFPNDLRTAKALKGLLGKNIEFTSQMETLYLL